MNLNRWLMIPFVSISLLAHPPSKSNPEAEIQAVVKAYHEAMARKDVDALKNLFHPDLVVFEAGGVDKGRDAYLEHHLGPELKELKSWTYGPMETSVLTGDPTSVVLCSFTYEAALDSGKISKGKATESMVLTRTAEGWRIRHLHWSSRAIKPSKP